MEQAAIRILMAHSEEKTTQIYLKGGEKALRDSDYVRLTRARCGNKFGKATQLVLAQIAALQR